MKINIKQISLYALLGAGVLTTSSCNDFLDREPINQITEKAYFQSADQLANYLNKYYNDFLTLPYNGKMYHKREWNDGLAQSDKNTDIMVQSVGGNTTLFATDHWEVPGKKNLQDDYFKQIRICNYFIETVLPKFEAGEISGGEEVIKSYIGEIYFMRAIVYFNALAAYGDFPIVEQTLANENEVVIEAGKRIPRNELARFILADLDTAISMLQSRSAYQGQRLCKEAALLFKSRVALFEGTFEKYHKGSGRVPGDSNWPGAKMSYNSGKTFNIDEEIKFFLQTAMTAAAQVADAAVLTTNSHQIDPAYGQVYGWNPYFEMYSQSSLNGVDEVLLWKQYNADQNVSHDAPYRCQIGCADGYTRTFVEMFLMKNGLPIYANGSEYKGDTSIDNAKAGRDERLQLFVWGESNVMNADASKVTELTYFEQPNITNPTDESRPITGYQPRKYFTYDAAQLASDALLGVNACPIFRSAETLLNYMEAEFELNGSLSEKSKTYWKALRQRAGVSTDIEATIAATDLSKESDFGVYSGTAMVDKTLYNIRRERCCELFSEGQRYTDLIRWRSFDRMLTTKWIPEGINLWDEAYKNYPPYNKESDGGNEEVSTVPELKADGSTNANVSAKELSKYIRPYSRSKTNNELYDGFIWHEAYYLKPISNLEMQLASPDSKAQNSNLYQNIYWPLEGGGHAEK